jgi:hypothetical protein
VRPPAPRAALLLLVGVGLSAPRPAGAEGPALRRLERPAYTPPAPSAKPSRSTVDDPGNQLVDADDRQRVNPQRPISQVAPGVEIDARAVARFGNCTATHLG